VDHRVEPPSWLPQGAAPPAADPEADEAPASDDAHALQDETAPADSTAEEFSNGNGHDGSYAYTRDDSYSYAQDSYPQEEPYESRGPFEEPTKPPFHDLPGAGYEQPPAPPPPGDDLAGSRFSSGVTVGLPEPGFSSDAETELADDDPPPSRFGDSAAGAAISDGGFSGSSVLSASLPDNGLGGGDTYTAPYPPPFPETPTASGPEPGSLSAPRVGTTTYAYPPPPPVSPPPAPPVSSPVVAPSAKGRQAATGPRRANLVVARLEPWSVMKFSFLISLVAWIVLFVAVALLYYALSSIGVFASLQKTLASVTSSQGSAGVDLTKWTSGTRVLGYTMLIGAVDVVLITALSTLGAVVYNLVTHLGGGIEITLKETE
jgi:hypothetical protein